MRILILDNIDCHVYFFGNEKILGLKAKLLFYDFRKRFLRINNQIYVVF